MTPPALDIWLPPGTTIPHSLPTFLALSPRCVFVAPSAAPCWYCTSQTSVEEEVDSNLKLPVSDSQCSYLLAQVHQVPREVWW